MGLEAFQRFVEEKYPGAFVAVDLLKISQAMGVKMPRRLPSNVSVKIYATFVTSIKRFTCLAVASLSAS